MEPRNATGEVFDGPLDRCRAWLQSVVCGLVHGHDLLLRLEPGRICLSCVTCSYETHGWQLKGERPSPRTARRPAAVFAQHNPAR